MGQDTETTANAGAGAQLEVTGSVPMYRKPEPLNYGQHGKLGIKRDKAIGLSFMKDTSYCLVVASEFSLLCRHYPIIFVGKEHTPVAVMGLRKGQNVFVREDATYEPHTYVPAFLRRYPFVLANNPEGSEAIVCIDRACELISEEPDVPFFVDGQASEDTRRSIEFLNIFESDRRQTKAMIDFFEELDLFTDMGANYNEPALNGEPARSTLIATYRGIPKEKIEALDAKKLVALRDRGYLTAVIAHQISLQNWPLLVNRSGERGWLTDTPFAHIQELMRKAQEERA